MRIPRRIRCEPRARDQHIEQIWPTFAGRLDRALQRRLQFRRMRDLFTADAISAGEMSELNVGTAEITDHVPVFLPRASAFHHDVVARLVITAVVANDCDYWHVVSRHGPQRVCLSEKKTAISLKRDYLIIGTRQFDSNRSAHAPAKRTTQRAADLRLLAIRKGK